MALKLMILLFSLFMDVMVMAGGHSREAYDDIVVVESPIIDLDDGHRTPGPITPSGHQSSGQYYTPGAPSGHQGSGQYYTPGTPSGHQGSGHYYTPGAPSGHQGSGQYYTPGTPSSHQGSGQYDAPGTPSAAASSIRYHGPLAVPTVLPDGTLADTPEVVAARNAHFMALEQARSLASADDNDDGSYDPRKYEYDEHVAHHGGQVPTRHYSGVEDVQGPLNIPYQRPLPLQQHYNGQYYRTNDQNLVNSPTWQNYPANRQLYGTHGYTDPQHTQVYVSQNMINKHQLERLAARGLLTRQYIDSLIAEHPENRRYLEQYLYQLSPDNQYTDTFAFQGVRQRPHHDATVHNDNQQYFTPAGNQVMSHSGNFANPSASSDHIDEQYSNVVAVQPPITNAGYDKPIRKIVEGPRRKNGEQIHPSVQHMTEQYSTVAESPIKSAVGTDTILKEVVGYSATNTGPKEDPQGPSPHQDSNLPVQSTLDNPVDPNSMYQNTNVQTTNINNEDIRYDQLHDGNTHYVPAPVNGRFVAINNLAVSYPYSSPYSGPPAQVSFQESGYLSDTPEVAAAKAAHFTAHKIAREKHAQWISRHHNVH